MQPVCPKRSLGRISSLQLVDFVSYGVVEEPIHVPANEVDRCKSPYLFAIGLPECAVTGSPGMVGFFSFAEHLTEFHFLEIHRQEAFAIFSEIYRRPTVRVDDAALITSTASDLVGMPPEVPEFGAVPANNEQCRSRAN